VQAGCLGYLPDCVMVEQPNTARSPDGLDVVPGDQVRDQSAVQPEFFCD
jgi:hypothetical protein